MTTATKPKKPRRKRCRDCEEMKPPDEVVGGLCDECSSNYTWCEVCREDMRRDDLCRHLFPNNWGEYSGSGAVRFPSDSDPIHERKSVWAVLDKTGLARKIRTALFASDYTFRVWGPIIGSLSFTCYLGEPQPKPGDKVQRSLFPEDEPLVLPCIDYGRLFTNDLTAAQEDAMALGVGWLMSLEPGVTRAAELETVSWIDEYLATHPEG